MRSVAATLCGGRSIRFRCYREFSTLLYNRVGLSTFLRFNFFELHIFSQIDSAELCLVVYDVMSGILDGHSSGTLSELMEKLSENGESIGSAESSEPIAILKKASIFEILNNVRDMYARKLPLILGRFLPIAKYLVGLLWILRIFPYDVTAVLTQIF